MGRSATKIYIKGFTVYKDEEILDILSNAIEYGAQDKPLPDGWGNGDEGFEEEDRLYHELVEQVKSLPHVEALQVYYNTFGGVGIGWCWKNTCSESTPLYEASIDEIELLKTFLINNGFDTLFRIEDNILIAEL